MSEKDRRPFIRVFRQTPTQEHDEVADLGHLDKGEFRKLLESIDWRYEAMQAEWAKKAFPLLGLTNEKDNCSIWIRAWLPGNYLDIKGFPDEALDVDLSDPWYSLGIENPPVMDNVRALRSIHDPQDIRITLFSTVNAAEYFEWFYAEDYLSLFDLFHWYPSG